MEKNPDNFELAFYGGKIKVQKHSPGAQVIFKIEFSDKRPLLVITRATHAEAHRFWTSIPEGRQLEAEEVGSFISEYFKTVQ